MRDNDEVIITGVPHRDPDMVAYGRALMRGDESVKNPTHKGFQPGNTAARGKGRPKGSKDKLPRMAKENIEQVFERLGGVEGMVDWALSSPRNLASFYCQIYPKILPLKVDADVRHSHLQVSDMSMSQLEDALAQALGELGIEMPELIDKRPGGVRADEPKSHDGDSSN